MKGERLKEAGKRVDWIIKLNGLIGGNAEGGRGKMDEGRVKGEGGMRNGEGEK